jgi:hypothetical protein
MGPLSCSAHDASNQAASNADGGLSPISLDAGGGVVSIAVSPLSLSPAFSPAIHDYVVPCNAGANELTVELDTSTSQTMSVSLEEDQALVVDAPSPSGENDSYWIRCLPHDFPNVSVKRSGPTSDGWYLVGNLSVTSGKSAFAMVVDGNGTPVWYRRVERGVVDVDQPYDNSVSFTPALGAAFGTDPDGQFEIDHLATQETEAVHAVGMPTDHHELRALPSGNRMVLAYPLKENVDLTGFGGFGTGSTMADCAIQELSPEGDLVWQWLASDHVDPVKETTVSSTAVIGTTTVVDVFHCNSIDVDSDGNLLVSMRHADAVYFVSKATGTVIWKLGGTPFNHDGAQIISIVGDPETAFYRQHDARRQPDGSVSLFDDHTSVAGVARGAVYSIDQAAGTANLAWQYQGTVNSAALGSFRRYADGSSVIGWGATGNGSGLIFSEVDAAGNDLFDLSFEAGATSYRAIKVPLGSFDVDVLRRTAGQ